MKIISILFLLVVSSLAQADWSNVSATAYSRNGEDPGLAAVEACNTRVNYYIQTCKQSGKNPVVWSGGCVVQGYNQNPLAAFASVRVQCY